ncbi:MAG: LacI family DNA-binding transcriptional regulator [Acidiferrobacterales bacterium]|nr:LacI family DNA-binding transcriptional regulator [Acidiferrobacterales bacterium]
MREKVKKAADELGYRTNMLGSSLRTAKTKNILAIMPDLSDTFNSGVISSMEATAAAAGYSVLFGDSKGLREREIRYGDLVLHKQADGVIFFSPSPPFEDSFLHADSGSLPPMVNSCEVVDPAGFNVRGRNIPYVTIDNVLAAKELVQHLIEIGHNRIGIISGGAENPSSKQRLEGYRQAHSEAGLTLDERLIIHAEYTIEAGAKATKSILQDFESSDRPTALFCMCDESAFGAMHVLREHGLSMPKDMAVAGFDDIRFASFVKPQLTTVAQPVIELGRHCVEIMIKLIEGKTVENAHVVLPHKLMVRDSTAGST